MPAKHSVVSFKVEAAVLEALRGVPNRSEFIRAALRAALGTACPVCKGTGVLTPRQMEHWRHFFRSHGFAECGDCHEVHLVCRRPSRTRRRGSPSPCKGGQ